MVRYFYKEASPYHIDRYTIKLDFDKFPKMTTEGSYNVLCARVMGLNYADYLRMCRDIYGAEVIGKDSLYPVPYFKNDEFMQLLLRILNKRMKLIMSVRNGEGVSQRLFDKWKEEYIKEFEREPEYMLKIRKEENND